MKISRYTYTEDEGDEWTKGLVNTHSRHSDDISPISEQPPVVRLEEVGRYGTDRDTSEYYYCVDLTAQEILVTLSRLTVDKDTLVEIANNLGERDREKLAKILAELSLHITVETKSPKRYWDHTK